jgi:hypothetical protein
VPCTGCAGKGYAGCAECAATGVQHEWATVTAEVSSVEELSFGIVEPTLEALIRERIAIPDLPPYGSYLEAHHVANAGALGSRYALRVDATRADIAIASREFCFYGFGPQVEVLDFVNVTGQLLEDDLVTLERAVAGASVRDRPHDTRLLDTLTLFVSSELNLRIAQPPTNAAAAAEAQAQAQPASMVGTAYMERAHAALQLGLKRVFGASFLRPALWLVGGTAFLSALLYACGPRSFSPWACALYASIAGAALGFAAELTILRKIKRSLPEQFGQRLQSTLTAGGGTTQGRIALVIGLFASASLSASLASKVPLLTRLHEGAAVTQIAPEDGKVATPLSIEQDRSTADMEGLYEIRQEARKFLIAHNKKNNTTFKALDPNLNERYPKCSVRMAVSWVPKSYGLAQPAVFVRCKKSVSEHGRKWEAIVPVARRGG